MWTRQCDVRWSRLEALARQPVHLHSSESVPALLRPAEDGHYVVSSSPWVGARASRTDVGRADMVEERLSGVELEAALLPVAEVVLVLLLLGHRFGCAVLGAANGSEGVSACDRLSRDVRWRRGHEAATGRRDLQRERGGRRVSLQDTLEMPDTLPRATHTSGDPRNRRRRSLAAPALPSSEMQRRRATEHGGRHGQSVRGCRVHWRRLSRWLHGVVAAVVSWHRSGRRAKRCGRASGGVRVCR